MSRKEFYAFNALYFQGTSIACLAISVFQSNIFPFVITLLFYLMAMGFLYLKIRNEKEEKMYNDGV